MLAYRPTSTHCFDLVKAMTVGVIAGTIISASCGWPLPLVSWLTLGVGVVLSLYIMLFVEERWQHAGYATRTVRYAVYRPLRFIQFCWWMVRWACHGFKPLEYRADEEFPGLVFTRRETLEHLWIISVSMSQSDMQHFYTIQECRDELKAAYAKVPEAAAN